MDSFLFYAAGHSNSHTYACKALSGIGISFTDQPEIAQYVLLPVPSLDEQGYIRGGGPVKELLAKLAPSTVIIGGKLDADVFKGHPHIDLLEDPFFAAENAYITAFCTLRLAMERLPVVFTDLPVLVIGWGRIGQCLCRLFGLLGSRVTVAARKGSARAMASALGFSAIDIPHIQTEDYPLIINTVPHMILPQCPGDGLKIDLASQRGLGGLDVAWERGLPGRLAPKSAGQLIARRSLAILKKEIVL